MLSFLRAKDELKSRAEQSKSQIKAEYTHIWEL